MAQVKESKIARLKRLADKGVKIHQNPFELAKIFAYYGEPKKKERKP